MSGAVFDEVAEDYDRHRPSYPDSLIDRSCERAGLASGAPVLEVGAGTGQLTRSLTARGLRVTALEPGGHLMARARAHLPDAEGARFINARLEDTSLPPAGFAAAFSASAIHWVDPDVGWRALADALVDNGTLALLSYFGMEDPWSRDDQQALRDVLARVAPEEAAGWPTYRSLEETAAGVEARRSNISAAWAWLGGYPVSRDYAAELFEDPSFHSVPMRIETGAQELNAVLGTMSFWARLSPEQRQALCAGNTALHQRLGRPIRSSTAACLLTARRARRP